MSRARVLIAYASRHGHTGRVAERVADQLSARDLEVVRARLDRDDERIPSPLGFDAVIVAASVHAHHHQREATNWVRRHNVTLTRLPSAFLSVSLTAADTDPEAASATRELMDELLDDTGWIPAETLPVAGALGYEHYDLPTRTVMRLVAARHGAATDVDRDLEFTDWDALDRFSERFADRVAGSPTMPTVETMPSSTRSTVR